MGRFITSLIAILIVCTSALAFTPSITDRPTDGISVYDNLFDSHVFADHPAVTTLISYCVFQSSKQEKPINIPLKTYADISPGYQSNIRSFNKKKKLSYSYRLRRCIETNIITYTDFVNTGWSFNEDIPPNNTDVAISEVLEGPDLTTRSNC